MRRATPTLPGARQLAFEDWISGGDEPLTSDDWYTPPELLDLIRDFFGGDIDLDPCAAADSFVNARVSYQKVHDGLSLPWSGRIVASDDDKIVSAVEIRNRFINPPYSNPAPWLQRIADVHHQDGGEIGAGDTIALVKADPSTRAWADAWSADAVLFFKRRVQFVRRAASIRASAPFPSALLYWGPHAEGFEDWFGELGHVCMRTPSQLATMFVERERADAITQVDEPVIDILGENPQAWPTVLPPCAGCGAVFADDAARKVHRCLAGGAR